MTCRRKNKYRLGTKWTLCGPKVIFERTYTLSSPEKNRVNLSRINSIGDYAQWNSGIKVKDVNNITEYEFRCICGDTSFKEEKI